MEANILEGQYKVSLDAFDVYLPTIQKFRERHSKDIVPLWSTSNLELRYKEFYEFEAFFDRSGGEDGDSECDENHNKYTCHICNIDVPKSYLKEHNSSNKHKTCSAIAEHALERIKQHMTLHIDVPRVETNTATYFCEPCALVIRVNNKANHEKSKEHAISVTHDRLLNNLLLTYIDKNKYFIDFEIKNNATGQELNKNNDTIFKSHANTDDVTHEVSKEKEVTETKIHEIAFEADANLTDLKEYIKFLSNVNDDQPKHSLSAVDENHIEIKAITGHRVKVSVDNFHGYFSVENYVQCRVCRVMVDNKETHKMIPDHMEKIAAPIKNKHCVRQLTEIWNHCILCNEIIENVDIHVQCSELHISRMIEAVIKNTNDPDKKKRQVLKTNQVVFCEVCNVRVPKGSLNSHLRGMKHILFLKHKQLIDENDTDEEVINYQMKKSKDSDELTCRICDVIVLNVSEHITEVEHGNKYDKLLSTNTVLMFEDRVCCEVCEAYMIEEYILYHIDSKKHKNKLKSVNLTESSSVGSGSTRTQLGKNIFKETKMKKSNKHFELTHDKNKLKCKTCNILIENDKRIAKSHRQSFSHDAHFRSMLDENEVEKVGKRLTCKLCNSVFRLRSTLGHINNIIHKSNLFNHKNSFKVDSIVLATPIVKDDKTVQPNENDFEPHEAQDELNLKETIYYHRSGNKEAHVEDKFPIENEQQTDSTVTNEVEESAINKLPEVENRNYYCKSSEIPNLLNLIMCQASDSHKSNVLNTSKYPTDTDVASAKPKTINQFYEVDKEFESREETEMCQSNVVNEQNLTATAIIDHEDVKSDSSTSEDDLQNISIHHLIKSSNNSVEMFCKSSEELLLAINKLTKIDDNNYFCDICTLLIPNILKFDHINSNNHTYKFNNLYRSSYRDITSNDSIYIETTDVIPDNKGYMAEKERTELVTHHTVNKHDITENLNVSTIQLEKDYSSDSKTNQEGAVNKDLQLTRVNEQKVITATEIDSKYLRPPGHYLMEITKNHNEVTCKACKVTILSTEESIKEHINGLRHIWEYNSAMASNKLKKLQDLFFCECCTVYGIDTDAFIHIDNNVHKENLRKVTSQSVESNSVETKTLLVPLGTLVGNVKHKINTQLPAYKQTPKLTLNTNDNNNKINLPKKLKRHYMMSEDSTNLKQVICKVCKVKVPYLDRNIDEHVTGFNHGTNYTTFLTENKLKTVNNNIYCGACDVNLPENSEFEHIKDINHVTNLSRAPNDNKINLPNKVQLHYMMTKDPNNAKQVICKVCKSIVPYLDRNIDEHVTGFNHSTQYTTLLRENGLKLLNNKMYCETCKENVQEKCEFNHINASIHVNNLSISKYNGENTSVPNTQRLHHFLSMDAINPKVVICKLCNIKINHVEINIDEHLKGSIHSNNHNAFLLQNQLEKVNNNMYCGACRVYVPESCPLDHIIHSKQHISNMSKQSISNKTVTEQNTLLNKNHLHYMLSKDPKNDNQVICKVCNMKVVFVERNMDEHVKGSKHANNYNTILIKNKMKNVNGKIYCEICNRFVLQRKELDHINDSTHITSLTNKRVSNDNKTDLNLQPTLHFMMSKDITNPSQIICKVCNVIVPKSTLNIRDHIQGSKHSNKYKTILSENKLKIVNDKIYCELCNLRGSEATVFSHIDSDIHKSNYLNKNLSFETQANAMANKPTQKLKTQDTNRIPENSIGNNQVLKPYTSSNVNEHLVKTGIDTQVTRHGIVQEKPNHLKNVATKQTEIHYLMERTDNPRELTCKICNSGLQFSNDSTTEHIKGLKHNSKYKSILENNRLKVLPDEYYCYVCTHFVGIGHEYNHMCDEKHKANLVNYCQPSTSKTTPNLETENMPENEGRKQGEIKLRLETNEIAKAKRTTKVDHYLMEKTDDSEFVNCKVCKVLVPSKYLYIYEHVTGPEHNAKFDPILNEESIKKVDNNKRLFCVVCKIYLQYVDVLDHIGDENHNIQKIDLSKIKTGNRSKAEEFCNLCQEYFVNMKAHLLEQHTANCYMQDNPTYFCETCKSNIPYAADAIESHESTARHKANFENILTENSIKIRDERECYCKICNLYFNKFSVFEHLKSVTHKWFVLSNT